MSDKLEKKDQPLLVKVCVLGGVLSVEQVPEGVEVLVTDHDDSIEYIVGTDLVERIVRHERRGSQN